MLFQDVISPSCRKLYVFNFCTIYHTFYKCQHIFITDIYFHLSIYKYVWYKDEYREIRRERQNKIRLALCLGLYEQNRSIEEETFMTTIAQQIDVRMKAKDFSIMSLEAKAGVKPHAVRNILTGKSKNPSAVNLQAIADVLGCTVKDLLAAPVLQEEEAQPSLEELLETKHVNSSLMEECVTTIEDTLKKTRKTLTNVQFLTCVREVYLHSLQKTPQKVNKEFAEWFIHLMD